MCYRVLFIFLVTISSLESRWISIYNNSARQFEYEQTERGDIELTFHLDGYEVETIAHAGIQYQRISHPESGHLTDPGMPELPVFTTFIALPDHGDAKVKLKSKISDVWQDIVIYPQEEWQDTGELNNTDFTINAEYYRTGADYPENIVTTSGAAMLRDMRVLPVTISPFQYNAARKELEVCSEVEISISLTEKAGKNEKSRSGNISPAFEPIYRNLILNYSEYRERSDVQQHSLLFIISNQPDALAALEYLKDWKRQKGFEVAVATLDETGNTTASIKDYLQDAYDNWENPPEYVCFCGDANGSYALPTWTLGDHTYAQLAGDDLLEDIIIGRLPFQSISTFQVLISKILFYEKEPFMNSTSWYHKALLVGDPTSSGPSTIFTCQAIKELMLQYPDNFTSNSNFTEVYGGSIVYQMNQALNQGVSFVAYRGFDGMSGWTAGTCNNGFMLPYAVMITCNSACWISGNGICEQFMQRGSVNLPAGAIGAIGSSGGGTHTCFNNALTLGIYGSIFRDSIFTMGGALTAGKDYLYLIYPQDPGSHLESYFSWNTLLGDPSLELWTAVPAEPDVLYNNTVPFGSSYLQVCINDAANSFLEGAWVTLTNEDETFQETAFSNAEGEVLLSLNGADTGIYDLVVTAHNFIPFLDMVEIMQVEQYVNLDTLIYDDVTGNNNGELNPGETVELIPTFHNYGSAAITNVIADFQLEHDHLELLNNELIVGNIAAGESVTPASGVLLSVSDAALDGMQGRLQINITDSSGNAWTGLYFISISGANLAVLDFVVTGSEYPEPGVESDIYFIIENTGSQTAENICAELICHDPRVMVTDNLGSFGNIPAGMEANNINNAFSILPADFLNPGMLMEMELHFSNENGFQQVKNYFIPVGNALLSDPLGPDEYGYWCYDDGDEEYDDCPLYDWIEIDPLIMGDGIIIPLSDEGEDGDSALLTLPAGFSFSLYGIAYDQITVCSNGWISPGSHAGANFMNHPLPGFQGPSPLFAIFWDDLAIADGRVVKLYDELNHYYIVQWSHIENGDTGAPETFQVILYDANYYPTATGDSPIKMQYYDITNNNSGSYRSDHGQFCSIGLQNEDARIGMTYTYNNTYPAAAKPLTDEMALLFTTGHYSGNGAYLEQVECNITAGDDDIIEAGETVNLSLLFENRGIESVENVEVLLFIDDPYFNVLDGSGTIEYVEALASFELTDEFSFEVSENIPDAYEFTSRLLLAGENYSRQIYMTFTAYWRYAFLVDQDSISVILEPDQTAERTFTLTNVSGQQVNYYLSLDERSPERDISGSWVSSNNSLVYPDTTMTWIFTVHNNSTDSEGLSDVWLSFPPEVYVRTATAIQGGSGGLMNWDCTTGEGVTVNWHGEDASGCGVVQSGENAVWGVSVILDDYITGDIQVGWQIEGDGAGAEPHIESGNINVNFYIEWIDLNVALGTLEPGETQEINVLLDATGLALDDYNCAINILSDSWFTQSVDVNMTVAILAEDDNILSGTRITAICPNPFNPTTEIRFDLAESGLTKLDIYNVKGQKVKSLLNEEILAGSHKMIWNGTNEQNKITGSGIYYLFLENGKEVISRKILLLK